MKHLTPYGSANRHLIITQDASGDFKYSVTNLPDRGAARDAYLQAKRFWVEQAFHEARSQLGMARN
jgi:hypothetical protein